MNTILYLLTGLEIIVGVLISVMFTTLIERKVLSSMQRRLGPNTVGLFGWLQALADGLKLFIKESDRPKSAIGAAYWLAPIMTLSLSLIIWMVLPFKYGTVYLENNLSILIIWSISSLSRIWIIIFWL